MRTWRPGISILAVALLLQPWIASAERVAGTALLRQITGVVYVQRADAFRPAGAGTTVYPGQRILVPSGSSAVLIMHDDCAFRLLENSLIGLLDGENCKDGIAAMSGLFLTQAIGLDDSNTASDIVRGEMGAIGSDSLKPELEPESVLPRRGARADPLPNSILDATTSAIGDDAPSTRPAVASDTETTEPAGQTARVEDLDPVFAPPDDAPPESGILAGAGMTLSAIAGGVALTALAAGGSDTANRGPAPGAPFSNLSPE